MIQFLVSFKRAIPDWFDGLSDGLMRCSDVMFWHLMARGVLEFIGWSYKVTSSPRLDPVCHSPSCWERNCQVPQIWTLLGSSNLWHVWNKTNELGCLMSNLDELRSMEINGNHLLFILLRALWTSQFRGWNTPKLIQDGIPCGCKSDWFREDVPIYGSFRFLVLLHLPSSCVFQSPCFV